MNEKLLYTLLLASMIMGAVSCTDDYTIDAEGVTVNLQQDSQTQAKFIRLQAITDKIIRITATPGENFEGNMTPRQTELAEFTVSQQDDTVTLSTSHIDASVVINTGEIRITDNDGNILLEEPDTGGKRFSSRDTGGTHSYDIIQTFELDGNETIYGLTPEEGTLPCGSFIISSKQYGLLINSLRPARFSIPGKQNTLSWEIENSGSLDYYFISGDNLDEVISEYRTLTGKSPIIPKWALGYWQDGSKYTTQGELISALKTFRDRQIPLDNIIVTPRLRQDSTNPTDNDSHLALLKATADSVHKINSRMMLTVPPEAYSSVDTPEPLWEQIKIYFQDTCADALWIDAMPNAPSSMAALCDGQRSLNPNKRVFTFSNSTYTGMQQYPAATWNRHTTSQWDDLKSQIAEGLNTSVGGMPYWGTSIGGYDITDRYAAKQIEQDKTTTETSPEMKEWKELYTRWFQFGAFCPLFLSNRHQTIAEVSQEDTIPYNSMVYYSRLRYRLMPYIYTLAEMTWHEDYTIMRPLVMDFTSDTTANNVCDQYMLGPSIMVSPVCEYETYSRAVYLPECEGWYDFYTGIYYAGGQAIKAAAPYEKIPLHVRAGSIIPSGAPIQYTGDTSTDDATTIKLHVYTGADAKFNLYEDDGDSYGYEQGSYSIIPISYNESSKTLTIGERVGEYGGMPRDRNFIVIPISRNQPRPFDPDADGAAIKYSGREITVKAM